MSIRAFETEVIGDIERTTGRSAGAGSEDGEGEQEVAEADLAVWACKAEVVCDVANARRNQSRACDSEANDDVAADRISSETSCRTKRRASTTSAISAETASGTFEGLVPLEDIA